MRKIPTLFLRDPADRRFVLPVVQEGCEWVLAGQGTATRKYDGTCVLFDPLLAEDYHADVRELQGWWARRELKPDTARPDWYVVADVDEVTGKTVGWEPADRSPFAKYLVQAVHNLTDGPRIGTHELLGPKINRDPEKVGKHVVIAHADADLLDAPRDFEGLARWLHAHPYEGIVWHHPDGRMAKLKRRDVRR
jgi:plasmid stabilization system protein ParE